MIPTSPTAGAFVIVDGVSAMSAATMCLVTAFLEPGHPHVAPQRTARLDVPGRAARVGGDLGRGGVHGRCRVLPAPAVVDTARPAGEPHRRRRPSTIGELGMTNTQRWGAEAFGTFWLVLGGCGTAVIAGRGGRRRHARASPSPSASPCSRWPSPSGTSPAATSTRPSPSGCGSASASSCGTSRPTSSPSWWARCSPAGSSCSSPTASTASRPTPGLPGAFAEQRLRRLLAGRLLAARLLRVRGGDDGLLPAHHHGLHPRPGPGGLRPRRHRPRPHPDPPHQHPGHQHLGEPGPLLRRGGLRRLRRPRAAVALHRGARSSAR